MQLSYDSCHYRSVQMCMYINTVSVMVPKHIANMAFVLYVLQVSV